jgi:hypothetical protein
VIVLQSVRARLTAWWAGAFAVLLAAFALLALVFLARTSASVGAVDAARPPASARANVTASETVSAVSSRYSSTRASEVWAT